LYFRTDLPVVKEDLRDCIQNAAALSWRELKLPL
jgi:hypothetical protein